MDVFQLKQHNTTTPREIAAGFTTFAAMAYILVVNPSILGNAGMDTQAVILATGLAAAAGCFFMAALTNYPIALAPAMGTNAYFAFIIVLGMGVPWQAALSLTFWNGVVFLLLSVSGLRSKLADAIPAGLQVGIQAGIGFFIVVLGMKAAGIIIPSTETIMTHGDFLSAPVLFALGGLTLMAVLTVLKVPGAILFSLIVLLALALFVKGPDGVAMAQLPDSYFAVPSGLGNTFLQLDWWYPFTNLASLQVMFILLILDLFDSLGTIIGVSRRAGLVDADGKLPKMSRALSADALATITGALFGTSTTTAYIESAAGIEAGGRTGLTTIIVGLLFLAALFFYPLIAAIPDIATAPVLIFVGLLMGRSLKHIPYDDFTETLTAVLTALAIPLFFSITQGLAVGTILYLVLKIAAGKAREVYWMTYVIGLVFLIFYVLS